MASKILFYTNSLFSYGGVQRVLAVVAKALSQNQEVTILTLDKPEQQDLSMYELEGSHLTIDFLQYPHTKGTEWFCCKTVSAAYKLALLKNQTTAKWYAYSFFAPSHKELLINYIRQGQFDVVIGVHVFLSLHLASIKEKISAKVIGWMHNSYEAMFEKENPYIPLVLQDFCSRQLKQLDRVVVLSDADKKLFAEKMNLSTTRIYNPLTIEVKGQADYTAKRFLSIGRMENGHKGFDILIKAFAEFAQTNQDWCLDIVGDGPLRREYQQMIDNLGLHNRISIHSFTSHVEDYYTSTSAYILASRWEGMPLVLCEAMAYGHSIIASDIPITRELLSIQPFTTIFPIGDHKALTKILHKRVQNLHLKENGQLAQQYATQFCLETITKEWDKLLLQL